MLLALRKRKASTVAIAAVLILIIISSFVAALLYISLAQVQLFRTTTETMETLSRKVHENIEATLLPSEEFAVKVQVKNPGPYATTIIAAIAKKLDGSLAVVRFNPPYVLIPSSTDPLIINIPITNLPSEYLGLGLLTAYGNVFPIWVFESVPKEEEQQPSERHLIVFYIRDGSGAPVYGATLIFDDASYLDSQSTWVLPGSYSLSTGIIPEGYVFSGWETSGGVSVVSPSSSLTVAVVNGEGSITMRLAAVNPVTRVTFDAVKASGTRFNSNPSDWVLKVDGEYYYYSDLPKVFEWEAGSQHSFEWNNILPADESLFIDDEDAEYRWHRTAGLTTSRSGVIEVPSGGGYVTAYYSRYIWVIVQKTPTGGGTVTPSTTGWYYEGQQFEASAYGGYRFQEWELEVGNQASANGNNPITIRDPGIINAIFYVKISVGFSDSEGYVIESTATASWTGDRSGSAEESGALVTFWVPPFSDVTITVANQTHAYYGYPIFSYFDISFFSWEDGWPSPERTIYSVSSPLTLGADYKTPIDVYDAYVLCIFLGVWETLGYIRSVHGTQLNGATALKIHWEKCNVWTGEKWWETHDCVTNSTGYFEDYCYCTPLEETITCVVIESIVAPWGYESTAYEIIYP
ncbi:MAG: hypothetical protein QXR44_01620 [Thermoproteota archaeon]